MIDNNFSFTTNISVEAYTTKNEATACLSREGSKAVGKNKMAFMEQAVTVSEFLDYATTGHAFCNLFEYDADTKYWLETGDGKRYPSYPIYKKGGNTGAMKLTFKTDRFFKGSQTVFVDIDKTRFHDVSDYIQTLSLPPTCVYMSFSDNKEKGGQVSRRFRLVYVLDEIVGKDELTKISSAINNMIRIDTAEDIEDDCGTRVSQYMNGVYGNNETYETDCIYSISDFDRFVFDSNEPTPTEEAQEIVFDEKLLVDMETYGYDQFMHYYSTQYKYLYRIEKPGWIKNTYQLTDENFMRLWYYREKQVDGQNRRRKLFKNACLRRLMFPDIDPNTLLFNLYVDFVRFFDNSDGVITLDTLVRKVKTAMMMTREELEDYCAFEIQYWKKNRPKFILKSGYTASQGLLIYIAKDIKWNELDERYDRSKTVKENAEILGVPLRTLYRYCSDRHIATNPNRGETESQRRAKRKLKKQEEIELFKAVYDPELSLRENREKLNNEGLSLSPPTISSWVNKYYEMPLEDDSLKIDYSWCYPDFSWMTNPREE